MEELFTRLWENLIGRVGGPLKFRLILQPAIAVSLGVRAGLKDAREGRPPYFWAIFISKVCCKDLLGSGWKDLGKVFIIAIIIDFIYQIIVLRWFYPGEALIVAVILAIFPYLLIRGPLNRIVRRMHSQV